MDQSEARAVRVLSRGSKFALALAALVWIFAAYLYVAPLQLITKEGSNISCGSAASPSAEPLIKLACSDWPLERRWQVLAAIAAGVVVVTAGLAAYGSTVRLEHPATDFERDASTPTPPRTPLDEND